MRKILRYEWIPPDVENALKELKPTIIRWLGGNYTSGYHWQWGAGPRKE